MGAVARRYVCDANGAVVIKDNARDTRVRTQVKVGLLVHHAVHVRSRSVGAATSVAVDVLSPDFSAMGSCEIYRRTESDLTRESSVSTTTHLEYRLHGFVQNT